MKKSNEIVESSSEISLEKRFELIREQIKHEDELINQRLNWLLLSQGFLIAAFTSLMVATTSSTGSSPYFNSTFIQFVIFGIPITGLALNFSSYVGLHAAYQSLKYLRENWYAARPTNKQDQKHYDSFPQITWVGRGFGHAITTATGTPFMISVVWLLLAIGVNALGVNAAGILIWLIVIISVGEFIWMFRSTKKNW